MKHKTTFTALQCDSFASTFNREKAINVRAQREGQDE
jgi:hypothetical protein